MLTQLQLTNISKLTCLEITGYRIKYSTVLWLPELQIRRVQKVWTQVHTVNSNGPPSNCQFSLFSKINPIIRIFCISGWVAVPINPDKWSSAVYHNYFSSQFRSVLRQPHEGTQVRDTRSQLRAHQCTQRLFHLFTKGMVCVGSSPIMNSSSIYMTS